MSCTTSPLRMHRPLLLAARLAAGAFYRPRLKRISLRRRSSWTPVLLRWSLKAVSTRVGASPRASGWAGLWAPHFHLHLEFARLPRAAVTRGSRRAYAAGLRQSHLDSNLEFQRPPGVVFTRAPGRGNFAAPSGEVPNRALPPRFASRKVDKGVGHRFGMDGRPMRAMEKGMAGVRAGPPNRLVAPRPVVGAEAMAAIPMRKGAAVAGAALGTLRRSAIAARAQPESGIDALAHDRPHDRLPAPIRTKGPGSAPIVHPLPRHSRLLARMGPLHTAPVVNRPASRADVLPSGSLASGSKRRTTLAMTIASEQSIHERIRARLNTGFSTVTGSSAFRSVQRKREPPSAGLLEAPRELARATSPSEITWRSNRDFAGAGDPWQPGQPSAAPISPVQSMSGQAHLQPSASRPGNKAEVCATALDPLLADRFADDVIRRMERRMRIERERGGL